MKFKSSYGVSYTRLTPEQLGNAYSRVGLTYTMAECHWGPAPKERWLDAVRFMDEYFKELGGFDIEIERHQCLSHNKVKIKTFVRKIENLPQYNMGYIYLPNEYSTGFGIKFPDLPIDDNHLWDFYWDNYHLPYVRLGFDDENVEHKSEVPSILEFNVDRGGHDGMANGGDYGWVYIVYTNGEVYEKILENHSWAQTGHRLNYHATLFKTSLTFKNHNWIVVKQCYRGLIYHYKSLYVVYGDAPNDFRKYHRITI